MAQTQTEVKIPDELKPADGRFGSGPSRVRPAQLQYLAGPGAALMGTSHRQKPSSTLSARSAPASPSCSRCPMATR
jgi:phosphoserine aminotransferase